MFSKDEESLLLLVELAEKYMFSEKSEQNRKSKDAGKFIEPDFQSIKSDEPLFEVASNKKSEKEKNKTEGENKKTQKEEKEETKEEESLLMNPIITEEIKPVNKEIAGADVDLLFNLLVEEHFYSPEDKAAQDKEAEKEAAKAEEEKKKEEELNIITGENLKEEENKIEPITKEELEKLAATKIVIDNATKNKQGEDTDYLLKLMDIYMTLYKP